MLPKAGQKSALVQLFWRYANFSKLMRTIHFIASFDNIRTKANEKYRHGNRKTVSKHLKVFLKLAPTLVFWA